MRFLYTLGVLVYSAGIHLAALFNPKAKKWVEGRKHWKRNLPKITSENVIWFHCASLGEFDQGLPVMNRLKEESPESLLLVSFFSPSGMEHYHKRAHKVDFAIYLPIDTKKNAVFLLEHIKPKAVFFVKYEFWSNFILSAKRYNIPVFSVSTLLRENQRFFKWYGGFFRKTLQSMDHFFVQNESTGELLSRIQIQQYEITGDTRFDRVIENKTQVQSNPIIEQFLKGEKAIIIGSSWDQDIEIVKPIILARKGQKFILAPHNIDEKTLRSIVSQFGNSCCLYSDLNPDFTGNLLILNTIGHLASAYSYGEIAYVGGGFSGKLHNILEPGVFGLPVIFGPKYTRFPEASLFIQKGIGFSVSSTNEFEKTLENVEKNLPALKIKAHELIEDQKGSSEKIIRFLKKNYTSLF